MKTTQVTLDQLEVEHFLSREQVWQKLREAISPLQAKRVISCVRSPWYKQFIFTVEVEEMKPPKRGPLRGGTMAGYNRPNG